MRLQVMTAINKKLTSRCDNKSNTNRNERSQSINEDIERIKAKLGIKLWQWTRCKLKGFNSCDSSQ